MIGKTTDVHFPLNPKIKGHANVLDKYSDPDLDIAFLKLQEKLPECLPSMLKLMLSKKGPNPTRIKIIIIGKT
jgi:hypothetical protein